MIKNFRFYKFCQNPVISILSSVYAFFVILTITYSMPWWSSILIGFIATIIWLLPFLNIFYPFSFGLYILIALFISASHITAHFYILIGIFILHVIRMVNMLLLAKRDPNLSLIYDTAIRLKTNPYEDNG